MSLHTAMTFHATDLYSIHVLLCALSLLHGARDCVAQPVYPTTPEELAEVSTSLPDHDGVHIKVTDSEILALEEGKYFVSLLFAKYGSDNVRVRRSELIKIFHSLGINGEVENEMREGESHPEFRSGGEGATQGLEKPQERRILDHTSVVKESSSSQERKTDKTNKHNREGKYNVSSKENIEKNKKYSEISIIAEKDKGYSETQGKTKNNKNNAETPRNYQQNLSPDNSNQKKSGNVPIQEYNSGSADKMDDTGSQLSNMNDQADDSMNDQADVSMNDQAEDSRTGARSKSDEKDVVNQDSKTRSKTEEKDIVPTTISKSGTEDKKDSGQRKPAGRKRKGKTGRRKKKGRNQKGKKKKEDATLQKRVQRDVSKESIHHFHNDHNECLTVKEILQVFDLENKDEITLTDFLYMSPAIIYQLDAQNCSRFPQRAARNPHSSRDINSSAVTVKGIGSISLKVWGFSFIAVLIISLVGLLGVAIIPVMQKVFYNHLLQFLVALAVGALSGDALLHLLPHALVSADSHHDVSKVWKGLCGLLGIFFFFIMERVLHVVTARKQKKKSKYGLKVNHLTVEEAVMIGDSEKPLKSLTDHKHQHISNGTERDRTLSPDEGQGHGHHGHSHGDGKVPGSIAAIAWMVILGDGIHNFSDGLAIGAAFASSITGGFSTSIAVFCHELPHEIGDFAMLLRTGMSVKQAIVYNVVSSVLCFVGMAIGVALGNVSDATVWIFACVGGLFIYIALVDMLPEMTNVPSKDTSFFPLLLQCSGMFTGSGIMLLIAVFEEDLLSALD